MKTPLSVCLLARDEEESLDRCLHSVAGVDDIIVVVDSRSTSRSAEIAQQHGARVISQEWLGWAKQKNFSISQAKHDWVLSLDADEWLANSDLEKIDRALAKPSVDAFSLRRKTYFLGRFIAHAGWYPDRQIRLFRKSVTQFAEVAVHEKVATPKRWGRLNLDIEHESYTSLSQFIEKNNTYTSRQAEQQIGQVELWPKLFLKPIARFLQTYLWQLGFLDGWQGLLLACLRSGYDFVVIAKIIEAKAAKK